MSPFLSYVYRCNGESIGQFGCESDRVSQTVNGVTTNYVLDSASALTQVLQDGTNTYVYGVDRIAQMNGTVPEYFLTDGLGSVRQLVDSNGNVTVAKSYQPYGSEMSSVGSGSSSYGFTGEMTDPTGLIYLRARYLAPETGRFLTKDLWAGDYYRPLSLNRWLYVEGNPVNYVDPSGTWRWPNPVHLYHRWIEDHYAGNNPLNFTKQLEYTIPGTGTTRHADMFNSLTGDVWEIEPWYLANTGQAQALGYVTDLNFASGTGLLQGQYLGFFPYNWNGTQFRLGHRYDWPGRYIQSPMRGFPAVDFVADYYSPGVIEYWVQPNALGLVLIAAGLKNKIKLPNKKLFRDPQPIWNPNPAPLPNPIPVPVLVSNSGAWDWCLPNILIVSS